MTQFFRHHAHNIFEILLNFKFQSDGMFKICMYIDSYLRFLKNTSLLQYKNIHRIENCMQSRIQN